MQIHHNPSAALARGFRSALFGSVAALSLGAVAAPALAQAGGPVDWSGVERTSQIVVANPGTPTTARDPVNVTGVGQMIIDQQNGFIGLCTGTLINPRTVIFAAHCVNSRAAAAYGPGGTPIGFGFGANNNVAGASAFGGWLGNHQTNTARFMYNSNHVAYHPASLEPNANSFLYGDVAVASLDTAAVGIPTWSMLFSALPAKPVTAAGTGYHVDLSGYGNNGTGTTGSGTSDFRRRLAENMLGALASVDDFEGFLFGTPPGDLPQNLYWIDFDDPRRGTAQASPFDFNAWRDNATPNEGITASGDSGGPLILDDAFAKPVVIGVLSGGYTRFFNGQPANGYGTASFYQPLYLYWDWIAANNPYHYVSAVAGDGAWTDPTRWVTNLDPNYQIIGPDGQLVNGVPTDVGAGPTGPDTNGFGQMCFQSGGFSECQDIATGTTTAGPRPIGTGAVSGAAVVSVASLLDGEAETGAEPAGSADPQAGFTDGGAVTVVAEAQAGAAGNIGPAALPAATLQNGLPGARNFVPGNFDGDRLAGLAPRYFDVTLSATGTTTLSTAVTIDRLTLAGVGAGLNIASTGSLFSNIDITQLTGTLNVDGALRTPGDFFIMTGGLSGRGTITTPFLTNMAGVIAPGTASSIGTLTVNGDVILASGGALLINLGANGVSDRLVVSGEANLGGLVSFSFMPGGSPRSGSSYTFLTAGGGVTGAFSDTPLSAILRPEITYGANAVSVEIVAGLYADVATGSPVQAAYAQLLDQNRVGYEAYNEFSDLYGVLDLQSTASIQATLDALAPRTETLRTSMGVASMNSMASFYRSRLTATGDQMDGSLQVIGRPVDYALSAMDSLDGGIASPMGDTGGTVSLPGVLPDNMRGFVAAGYLDGKGAPMRTAVGGGDDSFDGYFISAGVEGALNRKAIVGAALSTTELSGSTAAAPQSAESRLLQGTVYANWQGDSGWLVNGMLSYGEFDTETTRVVAVGPTVYTLSADDSASAVAAEIGVGYRTAYDRYAITPGASLRASAIDFGETTETGGGPALSYQRDSADSLEGRVGVVVSGLSPTFRPWVSAHAVHAFSDPSSSFGANFVGGVGPDAVFALGSEDKDWAELGVGLEAVRDAWRFSVAAETTAGRDDVEMQSYRAAVSVRF